MCLFHKWKIIKGDFNKYYECPKCKKRKVIKGTGGYQPIDEKFIKSDIR
ncbi:MAG TPA: hypothetical protein VMX17_00225 [Candidatus Glassbacteria bacterium]|nr:hypothetical protein [Candidatus Glassbacteria bacterium]